MLYYFRFKSFQYMYIHIIKKNTSLFINYISAYIIHYNVIKPFYFYDSIYDDYHRAINLPVTFCARAYTHTFFSFQSILPRRR